MTLFKRLSIFFVSFGYLISGLLLIPFTVVAIHSYNLMPSVSPANTAGLVIVAFALVIIPLLLSFGLWKGYRLAWAFAILFAAFSIVVYVVTFASISLTLSSNPTLTATPFGPLTYSIAYTITYLGTYLFAIFAILLNCALIYFLTMRSTKIYFGIVKQSRMV